MSFIVRIIINNTFFLITIALILTGVASAGEVEKIGITAKLTVHLYDSLDDLQAAYLYRNGDQKIKEKVKGFYSDGDNSIHCLKGDFYTCGHELYHVLQYKGDRTLLMGKEFEHFRENNYTHQ